jgi:hypothetical protein
MRGHLSRAYSLSVSELQGPSLEFRSFYKLNQGVYVDSTASRFIPQLTGQMLADAVELSKTEGQDKARAAFRRVFGRSLKQRQQD